MVEQPDRYRAGVVSGAPLAPIAALLDADTPLSWTVLLTSDPFYVDALTTDPLAFVAADSTPLARVLDAAWDRFGRELPNQTVPTLAVHAPPTRSPRSAGAGLRRAAARAATDRVSGAQHVVLNESVHREATTAVIEFIAETLGWHSYAMALGLNKDTKRTLVKLLAAAA